RLRPDGEGELGGARGGVFEHVEGVDAALRLGQQLLAPLRLPPDEGRVGAFDLRSPALLAVVYEAGMKDELRGDGGGGEQAHACPQRRTLPERQAALAEARPRE